MSRINGCPTSYYTCIASLLCLAISAPSEPSGEVCELLAVPDQAPVGDSTAHSLIQQDRSRTQQLLRGGAAFESSGLLDDIRVDDSRGHPEASALLLSEVEPLAKKSEPLSLEERSHVAQVKEMAEQILLPGLKESVAASRREVEGSFQAVLDCQRQATEKLAYVSSVEEMVSHRRTGHADCRMAESDALFLKERICDEFNTFNIGLHVPAEMPYNKDPDDMEEYLKEMSEYFGPVYQVYEDKHQLCEEASTNYSNIADKCWRDQAMFEEGMCTLRTQVADSCTSYDACWTTAIKRYEERRGAVLATQDKRAGELRGLRKLLCMLEAWNMSSASLVANSTKVKSCTNFNWNASVALAFQFPELPKPLACDMNKVRRYPCTGDFMGVEYKALDLHADVFSSMRDSCRECSIMVPTASEMMRQDVAVANKQDVHRNAHSANGAVQHQPHKGPIQDGALQHSGSAGQPKNVAAVGSYSSAHMPPPPPPPHQQQHSQFQDAGSSATPLGLAQSQTESRDVQVQAPASPAAPAPDVSGAVQEKPVQLPVPEAGETAKYFDLTQGAEEVMLALPCDSCNRELSQEETRLLTACKDVSGEVLLCGCYQVLCSEHVVAAVEAPQ